MTATPIQPDKELVEDLKNAKEYPRQTYDEIIRKMLKTFRSRKNQYDESLHKVQQPKMKEL